MRNLTDYELMQLVGRKRPDAVAALYDRYARLVYSYAWKALRDEPAARDVVQSVFLRLWTTEAEYDPAKGRFSSWLLTITRNMTTDMMRKRRREAGSTVPIGKLPARALTDPDAVSPEDNAMRGSMREQMRAAFRHLSRQQAELIEHFYWQGYSLSELAVLYGQPLGTVKNRLHQALKILRRHLAAEEDHPI